MKPSSHGQVCHHVLTFLNVLYKQCRPYILVPTINFPHLYEISYSWLRQSISLISTSALPLKFLIIFPACLPEHPRRSHKTYLVIFRLIQFRDHFNPSRRLRLCHAAMIERVLCSGDAQTLKERRRECVDFGFSLDLDTA
jgi:hypothetical protein